MAEPVRKPIEQGIVARVAAGIRYAITGNGDGWFGPMAPIAPVADKPTDGTAGRAFDFPVGFNTRVTPRAEEPISFAQMRALADGYDLLRLVIETRKDQFGKLNWKMRRKDGGDEDANVKAALDFFQSPDKEHSFDDWLRMMLEDMLVIDAVSIYPRKTKGGDLYSLELVDGATVKRVLDVTGRTPIAPDPAYQQILKGIPAINYTRDELIYRPRNVRTNRVYGYSPVEQVIMTVNIALRRQINQLSYYTEGNVPNLLFGTPPEWTPDHIAVFQAWFDSLFAEGQSKNVAKFIPGGIQPIDTKAQTLKDEMDEWLARIVCYAFNVSNQAFVKQLNRATGETAQEMALQEGLAPLQRWVKSVIDQCLAGPMGLPDVEFYWDEEESVDPREAAEIAKIYVDAKVLDADEVRADLGRPPLTPEQRDRMKPAPVPMIGHNGGPALDDEGKADTEAGAGADDPADKVVKKKSGRDTEAASEALKKVVETFLAGQVDAIAAQLGDRLGLQKSAMDDYNGRIADDAVGEVDFGWRALVAQVQPVLVGVAVAAGTEALADLSLFDAGMTSQMRAAAVDWAAARAAELVGMKWVDGALVSNPDARWVITEPTRDMIRGAVRDAVAEGDSTAALASRLKDNHAFSRARAEMISRTEVARADVKGSETGWKTSGLVAGKEWLTAPGCCDKCLTLNGTIVPIDEEFPEGDAPLHPHCRCMHIAVLNDEMEADNGKE